MSAGLYSMQAKDFDKTLDLTKIKPYGDTMNDSVEFYLACSCRSRGCRGCKAIYEGNGF